MTNTFVINPYRFGATYAADTFTRANGAIGTAETGGVWTQSGGVWTVASNKAAASGGPDGFCQLNATVANASVSANLTLSAVRANCGLLARFSATTDFLLVTLVRGASNNEITLYKNISNSYTVLGQVTTAGLSLGATYLLKLTVAGTALEVFLDGVSKITYNTTTGLEANTKFGMYAYNNTGAGHDDGGSRFDDFLVTS